MRASEMKRNKMAAINSQLPIDGASTGICEAQLLDAAAVAAAAAAAAAACVLAHSQSVNCLARLLSDLG